MTRRVLIVSNGHGEDIIADTIARELATQAATAGLPLCLSAFPLVGEGAAFAHSSPYLGHPEVVGPRRVLPTGGFSRQSLAHLRADLAGGLLAHTASQARFLGRLRGSVDLAICVGDLFALGMVGLFLRSPAVLVATAKSDYYTPGKPHHLPIEMRLMRRWARAVFARDEPTAASLRQARVAASWQGNIMMDCITGTVGDIPCGPDALRVGILPGSRHEAYANLGDIVAALRCLSEEPRCSRGVEALVAAAPHLSSDDLRSALEASGFMPAATGDEPGLLGSFHEDDLPGRGTVRVRVYAGRFADVLRASRVVVGLSGTGNEQAVGLGIPVVIFPGRGHQFTPRFAKDQALLLGSAVALVPAEPRRIAGEIVRIDSSPSRVEQMAQVGRQRMGPPGGAARVAEHVLRLLMGQDVVELSRRSSMESD